MRAESLKLLETSGPDGVVITRQGAPVARLTPIEPTKKRGNLAPFIGSLKGKVNIKGDIYSAYSEQDAEP